MLFKKYFKRNAPPATIGVFAAGHDLYWPQFDGLLSQLQTCHATFVRQLEAYGVKGVDGGMSDGSHRAREVADTMHRANPDIVICNVVTYRPSANVVPVIQRTGSPSVLVVAEGESLPGEIPATGNTNTRTRFKPDVRTFAERWAMAGPTHHFALGIGQQARRIEMLARALGMECVVVATA